MKASDLFPSPYLKASDAGESGVIVTMTYVVIEEVGKDRDPKPVLYFKEFKKGLVLNKTNKRKIVDAFGDETDNWNGSKIVLYSTMVEFGGEMMEGLRVRLVPPGQGRGTAMEPQPRHQPAPEPLIDRDGDEVRMQDNTPNERRIHTPGEELAGKPEPKHGVQSVEALVVHAKEMAGHGPIIYRKWLEDRTEEDYKALEPHLHRLWSLANKTYPTPPPEPPPPVQLSERAKKTLEKTQRKELPDGA